MIARFLPEPAAPEGDNPLQVRRFCRWRSSKRRLLAAALVLGYTLSAACQTSSDAGKRCASLIQFNLKNVPGGPAVITAARLVDAPDGVQHADPYPSGFSDGSAATPRIHQYCDVLGYVAPQNKFELKLPLDAAWNGKYFSMLAAASAEWSFRIAATWA